MHSKMMQQHKHVPVPPHQQHHPSPSHRLPSNDRARKLRTMDMLTHRSLYLPIGIGNLVRLVVPVTMLRSHAHSIRPAAGIPRRRPPPLFGSTPHQPQRPRAVQ